MFQVAAGAYDRFMGKFSTLLSAPFCDFAGVEPGQRVVDVGCGPGVLTAELVRRVGAVNVAAVDPSEPFVAAARERHPEVDVRQASAEALPFGDGEFDAALAQLVVHFMADPVRGLGEMARVVRPGGVVAASVWDHGGGRGPLTPFWDAAHRLDPDVEDESQRPGAREGHLAELFRAAGLDDVEDGALEVAVAHESFEQWWEPFTLAVGPAGAHLAQQAPEERAALEELCRERFPADGVVRAWAWVARGTSRS